jgi:hypothetical protein
MAGIPLPDRGQPAEMLLGVELIDELDAEISRLRAIRDTTTCKLEQAIKERDRLTRHLSAMRREEGDG